VEGDLGAGAQEVGGEAQVSLQQVGLDAPGRLHGHLGAVLENGDGELVAGQTGQPQAEVPVHLMGSQGTGRRRWEWWGHVGLGSGFPS